MAEVVTGEFSKYRNNLIDAHADMKVWLWDCGPEKPVPPKRPDAPSGKEGDPEYDLARLEFREALEVYEAGLKTFKRAKEDFADWEVRYGGPMEVLQWSCDAHDTLRYDAEAVAEGRQSRPRWYLSARTRGYEKLANRGLPAGQSPGRGQEAQVERQRQGDALLEQARRSDPVFGDVA